MKRPIAITALLVLAACKGEEITAEAVSERTSAIVSDVASQTVAAIENLQDEETLAAIERAFDAIDGAFAGHPLLAADEPAPEAYPGSPEPEPMPTPDEEAALPSSAEVDQSTAELAELLRTRIFHEDNIESQDGNEAVFLLSGARLCGADPDCAAGIDQAQLRIRARLLGDDGVELAFMIGPDRLQPLVLSLQPRDIAVELDLGEAKATVQYIAQLSGDEVEVPQVLIGKVRLALSLPNDQAIDVQLAILEDIHVRTTDQGNLVELHLAAANPLVGALLDGAAQEIVAELSANAFSFLGPYEVHDELTFESTVIGQTRIEGAGASYTLSLQAEDPSLRITNVSLGTALGDLDHALQVHLDDNLLFSADLNASSGRSLDLAITPQGDSALFSFAPELDLELGYFLHHVAEYEEVESFLLDETYRVRLSGAPEVQVLPIPASDTFQGGLKVVAGELAISSSAASSPVVVAEGQCLVAIDGAAPDAHPVLGALAVVSCP